MSGCFFFVFVFVCFLLFLFCFVAKVVQKKESVTTGTLLFFDHDVACSNASEHMSVCGVYACMSVFVWCSVFMLGAELCM